MSQCSSYHVETGEARCWGTREMDPCSCGGDQRQCDFYDYLRERAERAGIQMNRTLPQQLRTMETAYKRMAPQTRSIIHQAASEIERLQAALEEKAGAIRRLQALPAANVVEVRYCRFSLEEARRRESVYKCSACGYYLTVRADTLNGGRADMNYCPFCGRKVVQKGKDGGQDE